MPGGSDKNKKEFLADVTSFANASGGYIVYGIKEQSGLPTEVCGLNIRDPDQEKLRLEGIIQTGSDPKIPGVYIRAIPLQASKHAIIIRIPKSWAMPHMVKFSGHNKFYCRTSAGKNPLDTSELRGLFTLSETTTERIRNFRTERIAKILAEETPVKLAGAGKIVLHIIPLTAFDPGKAYDLSWFANHKEGLGPIHASGWNDRYNFDGFLTYSQGGGPLAYTYLQVFRNGAIEAVNTSLLQLREEGQLHIIPSIVYEKELLNVLPRYLSIQEELGVEPPVIVMLTLLQVSGYTMSTTRFSPGEECAIDRDTLLIPEVLIETFECDPAQVMRPIFDAVWNATGWPRSINYDQHGNWVAPGGN